MGMHDSEVIQIIGDKAWDILLGEVSRGNIDDQKMLDFSRQLGPKIGGKHFRRGNCDEAEMRKILSVSTGCPEKKQQ